MYERLMVIEQVLLALCRERLESLLHKWIADETNHTASRWETIDSMYKAYVALGGNGEIEELYDIACEARN